MDFDDVRKLATVATRTVPLCLAGEVLDEVDALQAQLAATPKQRNLGDATRRELTELLAGAQERMREATVAFRLRAMHPKAWTALLARQPTREDKEDLEVYQGRIYPWHAEVVAGTVVEPAMNVGQVDELVGLINGGTWMTLAGACMQLNGGKVDIPNFDAASAPTPDSGPA